MRAQFGKLVGARLFIGNVLEGLGARVQRAIDVGIFELAGQQARNGRDVFAVEGCGPILLCFDESRLGLWLVLGALGTHHRQNKRKQNGK